MYKKLFDFGDKEHPCPWCKKIVKYDKKHHRCRVFCNTECQQKFILAKTKENIKYCKICGKQASFNNKLGKWNNLCDSKKCLKMSSQQSQAKGIKNRKVISISKDDLYTYYVIQNHSRNETAKFFKCSEAEIKKILKKYTIIKGIANRDIHTKNTKLKRYNNATFVNKKKRQQTCINKYGVKNNLCFAKRSHRSRSKIEKDWLRSLKIPSLITNFIIKISSKKWLIPDGYDPKTNTVYEMLGDYWHGNLNIYKPTQVNKVSHKQMKTLNKQTFIRFDKIKKLGFNIIYIWESEYKQGKAYHNY